MFTLYNGDCLDVMATLPDKSIDFICCDLPMGQQKQSGTSSFLIGIEKDKGYFDVAENRLKNLKWQGGLLGNE